MEEEIRDIKNLLVMQIKMVKKLKLIVDDLQSKLDRKVDKPSDLSELGQEFQNGNFKCEFVLHLDRKVTKDNYQVKTFYIEINTHDMYYAQQNHEFFIKDAKYVDTVRGTDIICTLDVDRNCKRGDNNLSVRNFLVESDIEFSAFVNSSLRDCPSDIRGRVFFTLKTFSEDSFRDVVTEEITKTEYPMFAQF